MDSLNEALMVSWKEVAAEKCVADKQRALFDAVAAKMAELKNFCNEVGGSTATCRTALLHMQKNEDGFRKDESHSFRADSMTNKWDGVNTKFYEPRSNVERDVGFENIEMT